ncbi:tetratricopeptide repeat protein [Pusillimonas sp. MFBS29]|uniref:tetratricopeptide repeat protein n=1 Tax=Pusillimonas sp. MFBS29 TaxID=2886690 RepID=UPI001D112C80|nr:tetratricopeptide repeat protein [Pusillimonas sp. MFBS29]MCC2596572.1 tetratricopeptide repeat protein [Pusillimonas sp. MFBS29]
MSMQAAGAQTPAPELVPQVDLNASVDTGLAQSESNAIVQGVKVNTSPGAQTGHDKLFNAPKPQEGGWKGLARLLESLTPNIDTQEPLSASQITDRISGMLDQGQNQEALAIIEKRQAQLDEKGSIGTDVQLLFLHGRALAALGRSTEAIDTYRHMTTLYPELPEPWNNLAAEYVKRGQLDMAYDALRMALVANPNYATARANLGEVQLMLAQRSFREAAALGASQAGAKAAQAGQILSP